MIFNWFLWKKDGKNIPKIHETQKPIQVLKHLIEIFTDPGDVVIDPCAGSGSTLRAAYELGRNAYGFEISREYYQAAINDMLCNMVPQEKTKEIEQIDLFNVIYTQGENDENNKRPKGKI